MGPFFIIILFGSDQIRKFYNNEILTKEEVNSYTKTFSFETRKEVDAFILGIETANGWLDLIYFEGMKIQRNKFIKQIS